MLLRRALSITTFVLTLAAAAQASPPADTPVKGGTLTATWGGFEPQALFVPAGGGSSPLFTSTKVLERLLRLEGDFKLRCGRCRHLSFAKAGGGQVPIAI